MMPFEFSNAFGKKVAIRGKALHATISRNDREYIKEELIESGRSLARKYLDVNHEYSLWMSAKARYDSGETAIPAGVKPKLKGMVFDANYNHENGFVEYNAEVNHPEYVQKLIDRERMTEAAYVDKWGVKPIRYVSVDATYRFHREKSGSLVPNGIIFNGLSLVEDPETPGVEGTSVEVFEIRETERVEAQLKILQNLLRDKDVLTEVVGDAGERTLRRVEEVNETNTDEQKAIKRFKLTETEWQDMTPEVRLSYLGRLHEQDEECPEGQHRNEAGECVPDEVTEQEECPEGQHRNEEGECVPNEATEQDEECPEGQHRNEEGECVPNEATEQDEECPEGQHRNEDGECVADEPITEQDEECPEGEHRNEEGLCVPDEAPLPASIEITKLPSLKVEELHLGEPFADYTSFEDCVAKNSEKEDPEAYCASIQQQTEGGETLAAKLEETKRLHRQQIQGKSIAHIAQRLEGFQKLVLETLEKLNKQDLAIIEAHNNLIKNSPCSASVKRLYQTARKQDKRIRSTEKLFEVTHKQDKSMKDTIKALNVIGRDIKANKSQITTLNTSLIETLKAVSEIKEAMSDALQEMMTTFKNDLPLRAKVEDVTALSERLIKVEGDNGVAELKENFEALKKEYPTMTEISKLFKDKEATDTKALTETENTTNTIKETLTQMQADIDNLKDKAKDPDFKAGASTPNPSEDEVTPSSSRMDPAIG
jgi:hypothetical protein